MFFSQEVTVPANTLRNEYQTDTMVLTKGRVIRLAVFFPWGCAGLCYVRLIRRTWQVFPLTRDVWLNGNDRTFDFATSVELTSEPYELIIQSYNLDDTYAHKPVISAEMIKGTIPEIFSSFMKEIAG